MTFSDIARTMLNSMDFFELRKTAARYSVNYQGIRRQQLIRDIERSMLEKSLGQTVDMKVAEDSQAIAGAVSARPKLDQKKHKKVAAKINSFSSRAGFDRVQTR